MVARGKTLPKIVEIENKMVEIRAVLEKKEPTMSPEDIEELVVYLLSQNFV